MKRFAVAALFVSCAVVATTARPSGVTGMYVEARTSEVFAGACIINGEAATTGREALLAWRVGRGQFNGVALDGLAVVAAVAGDHNLSIHEIGGEYAEARSSLLVDARATPAQRQALVGLVKTLAKQTIGTVVETRPVPIEFASSDHAITVTTNGVRLVVQRHLDHDPSCGNKQWFHPLSNVAQAEMGTTDQNEFSGTALGTQWSDPNKRSGFFGTFAY